MSFLDAIILAIIEGLTEFLPISSTGHMIIASTLMGNASDDFVKLFTVAIQFGAILSVVLVYFQRFLQTFRFYLLIGAAFIPTAIVGLLAKKHIDALLENVEVVAWMLLLGGIVLLFVDRFFEANETQAVEKELDFKTAFVIGTIQCLAMVPGVSRSAATIIGGLSQKLTRKVRQWRLPRSKACTTKKNCFYNRQVMSGCCCSSEMLSRLRWRTWPSNPLLHFFKRKDSAHSDGTALH